MSTLPFLLSVADELDNINSQSYMDDFGLGFHPHRQYYRTPTIQLSLPASTDWAQQERGQRYRSHKFYYGMDNTLQPTDEEENEAAAAHKNENDDYSHATKLYRNEASSSSYACDEDKYTHPLDSRCSGEPSSNTAASWSMVKTSNSSSSSRANAKNKCESIVKLSGEQASSEAAEDEDDIDYIDRSVRLYKLSKKNCEASSKDGCADSAARGSSNIAGPVGYKLHSKCMEGNNSSSEESLQKVSSSIRFLTCFLLKKSRASSSSSSASSSKNATNGVKKS